MPMQRGAIEVWTARPEGVGPEGCGLLAALLEPAERERAQALRFDEDRESFVLAHALRRMALGTALGADPAELRFGTAANGRPVLLDAPDAPAFSLTRTRGFVACAIGRVTQLGIDAERVRPDMPPEVLDPFVAPLDDVPPLDFFLQWTALEAYWKAQGTGLVTGNPRIALRPFAGDDCFEVVDASTQLAVGMAVLWLPAPDGMALAVASDDLGDVRLVQLDRLAERPHADTGASTPMTQDHQRDEAPASNLVGP